MKLTMLCLTLSAITEINLTKAFCGLRRSFEPCQTYCSWRWRIHKRRFWLQSLKFRKKNFRSVRKLKVIKISICVSKLTKSLMHLPSTFLEITMPCKLLAAIFTKFSNSSQQFETIISVETSNTIQITIEKPRKKF